MESIHEEMKMFIDLNLPDKKEELIWIVNNIGKKIYGDTNEWKTNNIKEIRKRLRGWQLESFEESYEYKIKNGISLFKKNLTTNN